MFLRGRLYVDMQGDANDAAIDKLLHTIFESAAVREPVTSKAPSPSPSPVPRSRRAFLLAGAAIVVAAIVAAFLVRSERAVPLHVEAGPAVVSGTVFDAVSLSGVSGAIVSAAGVRTTTDSSGTFRLELPRAGPCTLHIEGPGYAPLPYERAIVAPIDSVQIALTKER